MGQNIVTYMKISAKERAVESNDLEIIEREILVSEQSDSIEEHCHECGTHGKMFKQNSDLIIQINVMERNLVNVVHLRKPSETTLPSFNIKEVILENDPIRGTNVERNLTRVSI